MTNMFFQTWVKYIPIIRILLKRSVKGEQKLEMNSSDFLRAAGGRKVKFSFCFSLHKGKLQNLESAPPLARDLIEAIHDDDSSHQFVKTNNLEFSMNKNFELLIKNETPASPLGEVEDNPETAHEDADKAVDESPSAPQSTIEK
jgi:hypothetical protein